MLESGEAFFEAENEIAISTDRSRDERSARIEEYRVTETEES